MKPQFDDENPVILIVEDNPQQLSFLLVALQENGYDLMIAQSGWEARQVLREVSPDLILLDVNLPDTDGFELCRELKQTEAWREIPVLFTTAATELSDKIDGFEAGGADYITKPFQLEEVLARVRAHLFLSRLQQSLHDEKERFKGLSDATFEGIVIHDQGQILDVNRNLERLTGYSREQLLNLSISDLLEEKCRDCVKDTPDSDAERMTEVRGLTKDGDTIPLEIQTRMIRYPGLTHVNFLKCL